MDFPQSSPKQTNTYQKAVSVSTKTKPTHFVKNPDLPRFSDVFWLLDIF